MNYIIIYATAVLLKTTKKPIRIFFASLIGALYAILSVLQIFEIYNSIIIKILVSILIIYIAVDTNNLKNLLKAIIVFYFVSFTFGGVTLALLYFIKPENILMRNGVYIGTYTIKIVLLGGILGYILITIVHSIIKSKYNRRKKFCDIEIGISGRKRNLKALVDSGNFLKEPITGTAVIVVEIGGIYDLVPKNILDNIDNIILSKIDVLNLDKEFINRFRLIPFNSLGKENGLLLGIKVDYMKILNKENVEENFIENIIMALYDKKLSKERYI